METGLNWPVTAHRAVASTCSAGVAAMETGLNWPVTGPASSPGNGLDGSAAMETGLNWPVTVTPPTPELTFGNTAPQWRPALIGRLRDERPIPYTAIDQPQWRPALIGRLRKEPSYLYGERSEAAMETGLNWPVTAHRAVASTCSA